MSVSKDCQRVVKQIQTALNGFQRSGVKAIEEWEKDDNDYSKLDLATEEIGNLMESLISSVNDLGEISGLDIRDYL